MEIVNYSLLLAVVRDHSVDIHPVRSRQLSRSHVHRTLIAAALLAVASIALAQANTPRARGVVRGVVTDSAGHGIVNAQVSIVGTDIRALTGADGGYVLAQVWPGSAVVAVRR